MRPYAIAIFTAALLALPTSAAFAQMTLGLEALRVGLVIIATTTIATKADAARNCGRFAGTRKS